MLLLEERVERAIKPTRLALEQVETALIHYQEQMQKHGLGKLIAQGRVSANIGLEFMKLQYIDSTLWVPMLAIMKDRVKHPTLKKALTDNLLCEAGAKHTSHVTLCAEFLISKGIDPYFGDLYHYSPLAKHPTEIMNSVIRMSEAEIAGWIMIAETIVPDLFRLVHPLLTVDGEEHGEWMMRSIRELIQDGTPVEEILHGLHLGGRVALAVPDALYAKALRGLP